MKMKFATLAIGLLASTSAMAQNGFVYKAPQKPIVQPVQPVTQVALPAPQGSAQGNRSGFGNAIPLEIALQTLVPAGIRYAADESLMMMPVSWSQGATWDATILDIANRHGIRATFGEGTLVLTIRPPEPVVAAAPQTVTPVGKADMTVPAINPTRISTGKPIQEADMEIWEVSEGRTLRKELTRWTQKAGWRLIYRLDWDYPIEASAVFTGTFEDAVQALMSALEHSRPQPKAGFARDNKALVILPANGVVN